MLFPKMTQYFGKGKKVDLNIYAVNKTSYPTFHITENNFTAYIEGNIDFIVRY